MKYIEFVNQLIRQKVASTDQLLLFGQNINAGSRLSGLTKDIKLKGGSRIVDTPNSENSLVGFGMGIMINGGSAVYFMKQLDFLLLGIDQLVNTYGFISNLYQLKNLGSFSIVAVVYDQGYQGVQSSLNTFGDFCSISHLPGRTITNLIDSRRIMKSHFISPGCRIIGLSARLSQQELIDPGQLVYAPADNSFFHYTNGRDVTIVCFNFSFSQGWELHQQLAQQGIKSALINVNSPTPINWDYIIRQAAKTKHLVIIDDSKSANRAADSLAFRARQSTTIKTVSLLVRTIDQKWLNPISDQMSVDYRAILRTIGR